MSGAADISDNDLARVELFATAVECDPFDALGVWMSESGLYTTAWNRNGGASGIFQAMPATLRGLGFMPEAAGDDSRAAAFRALSFGEQVRWAGRYYRPYRGKLVSKSAFYTSTFLPADLDYAAQGNANTVLVAKGGRRGWAFDANAGFDVNGDLCITVGELESAIDRACRGARWNDVNARMRRLLGIQPEPPKPLAAPMDLGTVRGIQEALTALGYAPGPIDGIRGPHTSGALESFQRDKGLDVDGIAGPRTRAAIKQALGA